MIDCNKCEPLLHCVLDRETTAEERLQVMEHLGACSACREKFGQLTALQTMFGELDTEVPDGLTERVMERVRAERDKEMAPMRGRRQTYRWGRGILAAAACVAVVFLGARELGSFRKDSAESQTVPRAADDTETLFVEESGAIADCALADSAMAGGGENGSARPESFSYMTTDNSAAIAGGSTAQSETQTDREEPNEALAAIVVTGEPAVAAWLKDNRPGQWKDVELTVAEVAELAAYLGEWGSDLKLPEGEELILTYQK